MLNNTQCGKTEFESLISLDKITKILPEIICFTSLKIAFDITHCCIDFHSHVNALILLKFTQNILFSLSFYQFLFS